MAINSITHIFFVDDNRGLAEEVKKRFNDLTRYSVKSFDTGEEFISQLSNEKEIKCCRIAILGANESGDNLESFTQLIQTVRQLTPSTALILLASPGKLEEIKTAIRFNADAYIPRNSNSVLRIHNAVKKLMSENSIATYKKRRNISIYILVGFLVIVLLSVIVAYFRFPGYF